MPNCFSDLTYSGQWYEFYSTLIDAAAPGTPKLSRGCFEGLIEDLQKYQLNLALNEALANKAPASIAELISGDELSLSVGENALSVSSDFNTAVGPYALSSATVVSSSNTAVGYSALYSNTNGSGNTAVGDGSLSSNTVANDNTGLGAYTLFANTLGFSNTAVGSAALSGNTTGSSNSALGRDALIAVTTQQNATGLGAGTAVTGSNQVQLGNSATTTYAYGAVQNRSDARDKADIKDTELGLDFIKALRPVDFKWDMREDYRTEAPKAPGKDATEAEIAAYEQAKAEWIESSKLANITHDGTKKRNRYHHGLIAQEVKSVLEAQGIDFGGFQNHSINGGDDVLSIGYNELIAPLIKAVQQLSARIEVLEAQN